MKANETPWFVGQGCKVPGSQFEWVVLVLAGNYALVGNIYQPGGNVRLVAVGMLSRPVETPKAVPGQMYEHRVHGVGVAVGLKDGRLLDLASGSRMVLDPAEWAEVEEPLPVFFANKD